MTGGNRTADYMNDLVSSGAVDVVGLGRPMTFVPDYPSRILAGETVPLPSSPPHLGYRPIDGYLELAYHNVQLHRIAAGLTPQRRPGLRTLALAMARITKASVAQFSIPA